jgi:hypothetical protein
MPEYGERSTANPSQDASVGKGAVLYFDYVIIVIF